MICDCGSENLKVLKVIRNCRLVNNELKFNNNYDMRIIFCSDCGNRYWTETVIVSKIKRKKSRK